jgi:hypothetical protein
MNKLTQKSVEGQRSEIFHMILFAMPWVMIGEYSWDFSDYALAAILVLIMVVCLGLYSIKLYELEDSLPEDDMMDLYAMDHRQEKKREWLFALIFIFEGIAILITWMILLKWQRDHWLIPCFALIAGLHFFPLARVIRHNAYYILGIWICLVAIGGFLLLYQGIISFQIANTLISYGCTVGAIVDGFGVMVRTQKNSKRQQVG